MSQKKIQGQEKHRGKRRGPSNALYLLAGSPNAAALLAQQKLQKGQTNTTKMSRNTNNNKKQYYFRP